MEGGGMVFEALLQNQRLTFSSDGFDSPWISNSFHGEKTNTKKRLSEQAEHEENSDEEYEKCFRATEKKRRLTVDQVQFLERSFEEENKLEPDRKIQLAKELNLQPRQVAIWFQNRRARCKTKRLEKDYEILSSSYDKLKSEFDCLQKHNDKLKHEENRWKMVRKPSVDEIIVGGRKNRRWLLPTSFLAMPVEMLKEKLDQREKGGKDSPPNEFPTRELDSNSQEPNLHPISIETWSNDEPKMVICKQEYANSVSAKSDVIDSYSPDVNHSSFLEPCDSSNVFENQSDFNQEEEDNLTILRCPKIEYESYIDPNEGYPYDQDSQLRYHKLQVVYPYIYPKMLEML
ncbi:hypothetical protein OSB04_021641 [Centaurea solstitialis]|uniref:Homeobox-leucine zipper protein n=1 Tax=Centaurea solstitialis TaxID=347529 RepID=A0AA38TEC4_9ASTR|nr:hypothetical protein OSB04_021641 [Centaurea solstitialis]